MSTYTLPLAKWLADPDYISLFALQQRLDVLLRAELRAHPVDMAQAFNIGHAAGSLFEAVQQGFMGVVADADEVIVPPLHLAGLPVPDEMTRLLDEATAIGLRRLGLHVLQS
jgi:hypothetical protein